MAYQTIVSAKTISTGSLSKTDQSNGLVLLSNGNYLSYWESSEPVTILTAKTFVEATRGQLFSSDGTPLGSSFLISQPTAVGTLHANVVALNNGGFAAAYTSYTIGSGASVGGTIAVQIFGANGVAVSSIINLTNKNADGVFQEIANLVVLPDGRLFVSWSNFVTPVAPILSTSTISSTTVGQFLDSSGSVLGVSFQISTAGLGLTYLSKSIVLNNGNIFTTWVDASLTSTSSFIRAQILDKTGKPVGGQITVNTINNLGAYSQSIAQLSNGSFVVTWLDQLANGGQVQGQIFNANGTKSGNEFSIFSSLIANNNICTVASLTDGRFVVGLQDYPNQKLIFQVFSSIGQPCSESFSVPAWQGINAGNVSMISTVNGKLIISAINQANPAVTSITIDLTRYIGTVGNDTVIGGNFNDVFQGGSGNDIIDGAGGIDRSEYSGNQSDYIITKFKSYYTITDTRAGSPDGSDTVSNVEHFQFANRIVNAGSLTKPLHTNTLSGVVHTNDLTRSSTASGTLNYISSLNYIASYADLTNAFGNNTAAGQAHFTANAAREKRVTTFNGLDYVASYTDLSAAFKSAGSMLAISDAGASHFITSGSKEKRSVTFNGLDYIASYDDLSAAFGTNNDAGAAHFINSGRSEGRSTTFNGLNYIASYIDLMNVFGANEQAGAAHYIQSGRNEERVTTFNSLDYIASYGDLINAFGTTPDAGATHYINSGRNEGRTTSFDGLNYIASYGDLISAFGSNEQAGAGHYISTYATEHRAVTFDGLAYIAANQDLMVAFGTNADAGTNHYITNGFNEQRSSAFNVSGYISSHADLSGKYSSDTQFLTAYINTFITTGQLLT